ncbi:MAG: Prenyltransferase and squalene oxidase repeat protein [Syntrophorhabdus sp. PtaU1.Bin153]|nr:MAG: Prenyltransferase and squalene oxidase repeat protein [Syntrophorhabdus sp. PtaU1.Bin153]
MINLFDTIKLLQDFVSDSMQRRLEPCRVCRSAIALFLSNSGVRGLSGTNLRAYLLEKQVSDGGWSDPEETAWAVAALYQFSGENHEAVYKAINWLENVRHPEGGWGRHPRDQVRIPTTALVMALVPAVATDVDREWVKQAWEKDLNSSVRLSYKAGFYLLTVNNERGGSIHPLVSRTIAYLAEDQNDDGGFGPWRDHPIGSDPWSTGVVLWGLSKWIDYVDPVIIEKALAWLEKTQLPSGYWAYHYLDEGTSYALIGAVSALRALKKL